jgi:uncharacterized protein YaeQ
MAIGASIYKAEVNLSNLNDHIYEDFSLTMAKHPSENELRLLYRLISFLYCSNKDIEFTKGLSTQEEPELWLKDLSGDIEEWIELGLPELKRIKQACGKSKKVRVFSYHPNKSQEWFNKNSKDFKQLPKLEIVHIHIEDSDELLKLVSRNMNLSCMIEEDTMYLSDDEYRISVTLEKRL